MFKHPEFFALTRTATKQGVKVIAVRDLRALESARRQVRKRKVFPKKGTAKQAKENNKAILFDRYPVLTWKEKNGVPTKRFKTYEYLFYGSDPIDKYFLTVRTKDQRDHAVWKPINDYDRNIANALHDAGHLTVEGYGWNKQLARKARLIISSDEFRDFCEAKFVIQEDWEAGSPI